MALYPLLLFQIFTPMNSNTIQVGKGIMLQNEVIFIVPPTNQHLHQFINHLNGIKWSETKGYWYLPYTFESMETLTLQLNGKANIEVIDLPENVQPKLHSLLTVNEAKETYNSELTGALKPESVAELQRFKKWLEAKQYSENTIHTYLGSLVVFLKYFNNKEIKDINFEDLTSFNTNYLLKRKRSASYQNQTINAIKLFFKITYQSQLDISLIKRPKRPRKLPNILSKDEIKVILNTPKNIKHKTLISLIYSCGLRSSELLNLLTIDIIPGSNLLRIRKIKSYEERFVPLSDKTLELIHQYQTIYKPKLYLFEGRKVGERYDERSLQNVFKQILSKCGMNENITLHWLRHSYATHLLENGVKLKYIQEILGHKSRRTTELYKLVSIQKISQIVSPFDQL